MDAGRGVAWVGSGMQILAPNADGHDCSASPVPDEITWHRLRHLRTMLIRDADCRMKLAFAMDRVIGTIRREYLVLWL